MSQITRVAPHDNPLAMSLYELERMVALSSTWQTLCNAASWTDARDQVAFIEDDTDPGGFDRPVCVISPDAIAYRQVAGGFSNCLRAEGSLWVYLAVDPPDQYRLTAGSHAIDQMANRKAQLQWASNLFGDFMQDLAAAAGSDQTSDTDEPDSNLGTPRIEMVDMVRTPEQMWPSMGQFWFCVLKVHWGDE